MLRRIRSFATAIAVIGLMVGTAAPASADLDGIDPNGTPVLLDVVFLRPIGLGVTIIGTAVFIPVGLLTAIFRHQDIDKPFQYLVKDPFTFTFMDPIGSHGSARFTP